MNETVATRQTYGDTLVELGEKIKEIVVLDADLSKSTMTVKFSKRYPERFFNMGIAEANMINTAAGLATCGKIPFVSSFSIFTTGRAWEQIRNTICYSALNVKIVATHSGISVGSDGASHQCIEDLALMRAIPGMTVVEPCDAVETRKAILAAVDYKGPMYIRLGRVAVPTITQKEDPYTLGKANVLRTGNDAAIVACGALVANSLIAADTLLMEGIRVAVINMHTVKPIDQELVVSVAKQTHALVTAEQHVLDGGLGSAVASVITRAYPVPIEMIGIDNRFGQSGDPDILFREYHLMPEDIVLAVKRVIGRKRK
ncbi:1-deoxy-D-xylulose-5-phosphate synthase [Candidatus Brocadiaceae bacterium B188]|nr:transketolase family protein [Candidatus Brocadia sapporoensis]QQR67966.1 MAG: transketolase family protein [Candidatus Brocadia sp.]RZV58072.1 MAG: transketolase family protein [Candidatus Brocadia sp. BROELEC01]TWU52825.1 1-deoxy-D-xylulose-5-phosphate synthase [Candidatus Brocadiaceae bacterium B188]